MSQHGFLSWAALGFSFNRDGVSGSPGWFTNSGEFGIQLCIFVPMALYFIIALNKYWGKFKKAFFYAMPFTGIASIVATTSRGALLAIGLVFAIMVLKSKYFIKAIIGFAITSVIVYFSIPDELMARFTTAGSDDTSTSRLERWKDGIEMMNEHPVFGVGFNNWLEYCESKSMECADGFSHNIFVQVGSELGYTGLILFIVMILLCLKATKDVRRMAKKMEDNFSAQIAQGLDYALIGYLASGFFVTVMYYPYFWIHMVFVVTLYNYVHYEYQKLESKEKVEISHEEHAEEKLNEKPTW